MIKQKGLGRGFGSLLPDDFDKSVLLDKKDRVEKILISDIKPNPNQPRKHFDQTSLDELAQSIKNYGILQPLVVMPEGKKFIIIAGERRYKAAQKAGLRSIPALVRSSHELEMLEIGLVENVQREDLSPLEQAISIARLHEQFNMSYDEIAKRLGKANSTVVNIVRLLGLPKDASKALTEKKISEGHARTILALKDNLKLQKELLDNIVTKNWSVRRAEQFVNDTKKPVEAKAKKTIHEKQTIDSEKLAKKLEAKVILKPAKNGGKIEIYYASDSDLKRILGHLNS